MATVQVADAGGDEMTLFSYEGFLYPTFPSNAVTKMPSVKMRSDDILIATFPKSGTHWVHEITRLLVAGTSEKTEIGKGEGMMEYLEESEYKDRPSPRILNSHVLFRHLPDDTKEKKPRILLVHRNPKDVILSFYHFHCKIPLYNYSGKWDNYFRPCAEGKFDYGSWFDYVKDWEEVKNTIDIPILSLTYEDLKEDTLREVTKMNEFLGTNRDQGFLKEVVDVSSFDSMKSHKQYSDWVYRKGAVGDWKNWFTVAQNEWFDQLYQQKMKDCPLQFKYTGKI